MATGFYVGTTPIGKVSVGVFSENGFDTSSATAQAEDILNNKVAFNAAGRVVGRMPDNGTVNKLLDVNTTSQSIAYGKHSGEGEVYISLEERTVTPTTSVQTITPSSGKVLSKVTINAAQTGSTINTQEKTVTPTKNTQYIVPDSGYNALSQVTVEPIPDNYIEPSGTLNISSNGVQDVTNYASVNVNVAGGSDDFDEYTIYPSAVEPITAQEGDVWVDYSNEIQGGLPSVIAAGDTPVLMSSKLIARATSSSSLANTGISITVPKSGTYRFKWGISEQNEETIYTRLYKNGSAVGSQHSVGALRDLDISEDIACEAGDTVVIYLRGQDYLGEVYGACSALIACINWNNGFGGAQ